MADQTKPCSACQNNPAHACSECMRALALRNFWTISRDPESLEPGQEPCQMCQAGVPELCGNCLVDRTAEYRASLRADNGHEIAGWGDNIDHFGQRHTDQQLHSSGKRLVDRAETFAGVNGPEAAPPDRHRIHGARRGPGRPVRRRQMTCYIVRGTAATTVGENEDSRTVAESITAALPPGTALHFFDDRPQLVCR